MPSVGEEARVWATEEADDADSSVLSGRGVSARVLPRVNAAAALANLAGLLYYYILLTLLLVLLLQ
jgi:hypothetical protein